MNFAFSFVVCWLIASISFATPLELDETPAASDAWGYRPATGSLVIVSPPSFSWRPQKDVVSWELECTDAERAVG